MSPFRSASSFSENTNATFVEAGAVYQFRTDLHPFGPLPLSITQPNRTQKYLGTAQRCQITLEVACAPSSLGCLNGTYPYIFIPDDSPGTVPLLHMYFAVFPEDSGLYTIYIPTRNGYGCPKNMVWVCRRRSYLYLPKDWSGKCYLSHLVPTLSVYAEPPEREGSELGCRVK